MRRDGLLKDSTAFYMATQTAAEPYALITTRRTGKMFEMKRGRSQQCSLQPF